MQKAAQDDLILHQMDVKLICTPPLIEISTWNNLKIM